MHEKIIGAALPPSPALAFLGDARYSVYVRRMLIGRGLCKSAELNAAALDYVTAEKQAQRMRVLLPHLTEDEAEVARRAQNSTHLNRPKRASGADYRLATAFEALIGMLDYIGDDERFAELMEICHRGETNDDSQN